MWEYFVLGKIQKFHVGHDFITLHKKYVALWLPIIEYLDSQNIIPTNPLYKTLLYFW